MLIKYSDGTEGIVEYLRTGRKKDRDFSRESSDRRVTILGDIEATEAILAASDKGYKHITLSFKEDSVSEEECQKLISEYMAFLMHGYKKEEYNAYAEIHYPKLKSYVSKSGELVVRKPHIHLVVPKVNLLNGQLLRPLGFVKQNIAFTDAFQEKFNIENGYASPDINRSGKLTNEFKERYNYEIFEKDVELKNELIDIVLKDDIRSYEEFKTRLGEFGATKETRATKKRDGYLSVKEPHNNKYVRLKEYMFSREFIENFTKEQKIDFLLKKEDERYVEKSEKRVSAELKQYDKDLKYWFDVRALELKYLNQSTKFYKDVYSNYSKEQRMEYLAALERDFYQKNGMSFEPGQELASERLEIDIDSSRGESIVTQKLNDYARERFYGVIGTNIDIQSVYSTLTHEKGVNEDKYQLRRDEIIAGSKTYGDASLFLKEEMQFENSDYAHIIAQLKIKDIEMDKNQINELFTQEQLKNRNSEKTSDGFLNAAALKFGGVSESKLKNWRDREVQKGGDAVQYDNFIVRAIENARKLMNMGVFKETAANEFEFTDEAAKVKVFENYQDTSKIEASKEQVQEKRRERMSEAVKAPVPEKIEEAENGIHVDVNIKVNEQNPKMADYYQIGTTDVAGRFTGVIHDKASEHDTAKVYVINDKAVTLEEFESKKLPLLKSIEQKQEKLFDLQREFTYNKKLRCEVSNIKPVLTVQGRSYANGSHNMNNNTKPMQAGVTKFDKKLDKNFFQIAKDFITAKDLRDDIKVFVHDFKQNVKQMLTSRSELAASNILLAAQLKEMQVNLDAANTYVAAQELAAKHQQQRQEQKLAEQREAEKKPELSFRELAQRVEDIYEKSENVAETQEQIQEIEEFCDTLSDRELQDTREIAKFFDNIRNGKIDESVAYKTLDLAEGVEDIMSANLLAENGIVITTREQVQSFTQIVRDAAEMAKAQSIPLERLLQDVVSNIKANEQSKGQER